MKRRVSLTHLTREDLQALRGALAGRRLDIEAYTINDDEGTPHPELAHIGRLEARIDAAEDKLDERAAAKERE